MKKECAIVVSKTIKFQILRICFLKNFESSFFVNNELQGGCNFTFQKEKYRVMRRFYSFPNYAKYFFKNWNLTVLGYCFFSSCKNSMILTFPKIQKSVQIFFCISAGLCGSSEKFSFSQYNAHSFPRSFSNFYLSNSKCFKSDFIDPIRKLHNIGIDQIVVQVTNFCNFVIDYNIFGNGSWNDSN